MRDKIFIFFLFLINAYSMLPIQYLKYLSNDKISNYHNQKAKKFLNFYNEYRNRVNGKTFLSINNRTDNRTQPKPDNRTDPSPKPRNRTDPSPKPHNRTDPSPKPHNRTDPSPKPHNNI